MRFDVANGRHDDSRLAHLAQRAPNGSVVAWAVRSGDEENDRYVPLIGKFPWTAPRAASWRADPDWTAR